MKLFWGIMAALVLATVVVFVVRGGGEEPAALLSDTDIGATQAMPTAAPLEFDSSSTPRLDTEPPEAIPVQDEPSVLDAKRTPVDVIGDVDRAISELTGIPLPAKASPDHFGETASATKPVSDSVDSASTTPEPSSNPDATVAASSAVKLETVEDGWTRVDDRFLIRGQGTAEDPYIIPWDLLISASESYRPRLGKKVLPERVTMLADKHVRITGFLLFPLFTSSATELLIMRNQWDGCCIGIPPTPYDAVEVKVVQAVERQHMFVQYATIEGIMKVEPYVNRDWLLGLYIIENAKVLQMSDEGVQKPTHSPGAHPGGGAMPAIDP